MQHDLYHDADVIQRLNNSGYNVFHDNDGYIIRHWRDVNDVSCARDFADLSDFADLVEWAAKRTIHPTESDGNE